MPVGQSPPAKETIQRNHHRFHQYFDHHGADDEQHTETDTAADATLTIHDANNDFDQRTSHRDVHNDDDLEVDEKEKEHGKEDAKEDEEKYEKEKEHKQQDEKEARMGIRIMQRLRLFHSRGCFS
ncbi:MAG: hypothetical protein NTZ35_01455 [Ignavibacteriales bacterium]|nr:hypothetical protein [Ignavibacteriales bacterium]